MFVCVLYSCGAMCSHYMLHNNDDIVCECVSMCAGAL